MKRLATLLFLLSVSIAYAEEKKKLYKWTDENGVIHYSDLPQNGAEEIEMKLAPSIKMEKSPVIKIPKLKNNRATVDAYDSASLSQPLDQGIIRNNTETVTLTADLQPALQDGHSIRFFVDGGLVKAEPGASSVEAKNIGLGQHSANFIVVNASGKQLITSSTVRFQRLNRVNPKIRKKQKASRSRTNN
jgi:hypothetical protein